jgi:hypothetical protein
MATQFYQPPITLGKPDVKPFTGAAPTATKYADFAAPDPANFAKDPSYQFRLSEGQRALEHSAAARGNYFNPNTMRSLVDFGQGAASQEYGNAFNRALQSYGVNRDTAQQDFTNRGSTFDRDFGTYTANTANELARNAAENAAATSAYDRNFTLARTMFEDEQARTAPSVLAEMPSAPAGYGGDGYGRLTSLAQPIAQPKAPNYTRPIFGRARR